MKRTFFILAMVMMLTAGFTQEAGKTEKVLPKKFATVITLYNDFWQGSFTNMKPRFLNQGADVYAMYNIAVENSPLIFAIGTGIGTHNLYSDAILKLDSNRNYQFVKINSIKDTAGNSLNYKKSKISVTYWDFPFEFRYEAQSGFRLGLGMKFGFVLSSLSKYKGDDLDGAGIKIKEKTKDLRNMEKWRYGLTARIGYKRMELYGYYSLTNLFKKDQGPELSPISIGISLRPLFLN
ncbi:MAG: outer membrane beta-barrel protein [Bacteroidetes bacterium]|nr:outer membrane beta-barrel protein [Bacteroidota bacterium]